MINNTNIGQSSLGYATIPNAAPSSRQSTQVLSMSLTPAGNTPSFGFNWRAQLPERLQNLLAGLSFSLSGASKSAIEGWEAAKVLQLYSKLEPDIVQGTALRFYGGPNCDEYLGYVSPTHMSISDESGIGSGFIEHGGETIFYKMANQQSI